MSVQPKEPSFSKFRATIWPIQNDELKKFLPMAGMMFLILFNYTLLRNVKDALVVTAPECGAEVIPFLKLFAGMPSAVLFFFIYVKLSNIFSREKLFYICLLPFLIFFAAFALVIYPNKELIHPSLESIQELRQACPNLKWIISIYGNWSFVPFYILSELWGVVAFALLFWQFANEITRTREAQRFYPYFGFLAQLALICCGLLIQEFVGEDWSVSLNYMTGAIVFVIAGIVTIYWWMNRYVLIDPLYYDAAESVENKKKEDKPKLSIKESLRYLMSSKYLGCIALLVICYGTLMNCVDVTWKSQIKELYPDSNDYLAFMGHFSIWTGVGTMILMFTTKGIIRRFGWHMGALATPLMMLITSLLFFAFVIFRESLDNQVIQLGISSVFMAVMIGAVQNILVKGTKYSLFDPTKEMTYIPLDQELKVKGKAAVDVIGSRLGKSSGGMIEVVLLSITGGTQILIAPYLFVITIVLCIVWIGAVKALSRLYSAKVSSPSA